MNAPKLSPIVQVVIGGAVVILIAWLAMRPKAAQAASGNMLGGTSAAGTDTTALAAFLQAEGYFTSPLDTSGSYQGPPGPLSGVYTGYGSAGE